MLLHWRPFCGNTQHGWHRIGAQRLVKNWKLSYRARYLLIQNAELTVSNLPQPVAKMILPQPESRAASAFLRRCEFVCYASRHAVRI
jgi:hypothetical protein